MSEELYESLLYSQLVGGSILLLLVYVTIVILLLFLVGFCIWVLPFFLIVKFVFKVDTHLGTWLKVYVLGYIGIVLIGLVFRSIGFMLVFLLGYLFICGITRHFRKKQKDRRDLV